MSEETWDYLVTGVRTVGPLIVAKRGKVLTIAAGNVRPLYLLS